jgi:hypothetical protein
MSLAHVDEIHDLWRRVGRDLYEAQWAAESAQMMVGKEPRTHFEVGGHEDVARQTATHFQDQQNRVRSSFREIGAPVSKITSAGVLLENGMFLEYPAP